RGFPARAGPPPTQPTGCCGWVGLLDLADCPAEAGELAGGGDGDQGAAFVALLQSCPGAVQAALRGPGDRDRLGWLASLSFGERGADPRAFAVMPRSLDQQPARVRGAGLGDRPEPALLAAARLGGDQPDVAHQLRGLAEVGEV